MRLNGFSLILIKDILILNLLWKQRLTKLFHFWTSLLITGTIFWIQLLIINGLILVYYLILTVLLLNFNSFKDKLHSNSDPSDPESNKTRFYKLPYIGKYSYPVQKKLSKICKQFCKDADLKIVFTSFKINNYFSKIKQPIFWNLF